MTKAQLIHIIENVLLLKGHTAKIHIVPIEKSTSQADTCYQALTTIDAGDSSCSIKDADNAFSLPCINRGNLIAFVDLNNPNIKEVASPWSKSYISTDALGNVETIVEKRVISSKFCCGFYQFERSDEFISAASLLLARSKQLNNEKPPEVYISNCIFEMMAKGCSFSGVESDGYTDFGDLTSFRRYCSSTKTLFCDFDGVLVKNSSKFATPPWSFVPIVSNLHFVAEQLTRNPTSTIVITTSRPRELEEPIRSFLAEYGIFPHSIICSLPHSKRIIINDYAGTNPYPSCGSVCIPRDSECLSEYLEC